VDAFVIEEKYDKEWFNHPRSNWERNNLEKSLFLKEQSEHPQNS
jgi:hypothetical protein